MASDTYHEAPDRLSDETKNLHRALVSLMEELEAIDWYQQRVDVSSDEDLRRTLGHNRNEEIEHACMVLEWIRRHHPYFDRQLRTYLFTSGPIDEIEESAEGKAGTGSASSAGALGIGSLRG